MVMLSEAVSFVSYILKQAKRKRVSAEYQWLGFSG